MKIFLCQQAGHGIPVFISGPSQRGRSIGSFFSGLGRMVLPWIRTGGKDLLPECRNRPSGPPPPPQVRYLFAISVKSCEIEPNKRASVC